jgi:hypothetical protein
MDDWNLEIDCIAQEFPCWDELVQVVVVAAVVFASFQTLVRLLQLHLFRVMHPHLW